MADTPINNQNTQSGGRTKKRSLVAIALLGLLGCVFVSLGNWQLSRADERREIAAMIEAGRQSPPINLTATTITSALKPWQSAQASGHWLAQFSVLLDNRNLDGKPGFWLATPLALTNDTAVLVLRGWVARPIGNYNPFPVVEQDKAAVSVKGEVAMRVPQLFELSDDSPLAIGKQPVSALTEHRLALNLNQLPQRQNVSTAEMSQITGLNFLPVVLMQTDPTDGVGLQRQWPTPSIDSDTNMGYAMQWFSFAAIAFGAMGILLWKALGRAKIRR